MADTSKRRQEKRERIHKAHPVRPRPSEVFIDRLKTTRDARGLSQTKLARLMTEAGRPMSKPAILRIEGGERGLSLDEALAFCSVLKAAPATMLSPAEGEMVWMTDDYAVVDGEGLRNWLRFGAVFSADTTREKLREGIEQVVLDYAQALLDANNNGDRAGVRDAVKGLAAAAVTYGKELHEKGVGDAA